MKVNEIFYSLQGEGRNTGTPATFIRLCGCNLGCPFCDTDFLQGKEMSDDEIIAEVIKNPASLVVITGGEPSLQLTYAFVEKLHDAEKYVAIETNGTHVIPDNVDWVTVSPKQSYVGEVGSPVLHHADEVKVVFDGINDINDYGIVAKHYYVQPCDTGDEKRNKEIINQCIQFVKENPIWKISLQTHKMLNVR